MTNDNIQTTAEGPQISENLRTADALSPFRLLNNHAMSGSFSVKNFLDAENATAAETAQKSKDVSIDLEDPVTVGLINLPIAMQLFDR